MTTQTAIVSAPTEVAQVERDRIMAFEAELKKLPQAECPVRHWFAPGLYMREMLIPAGVCLTGKIHRHEHFCIISQGELSVYNEDGVKHLAAPCTFVSPPGVKRVGYAHTDTIFTTIHANPDDERDVDTLEKRYVCDTYQELLTWHS